MKDQGFDLVAAAQDTGRERSAGKWYDEAKATCATLIDPGHALSAAYQLVNVAFGVWIDEKALVVTPPETASPKTHGLKIGSKAIRSQGDIYVAAWRDWVAKGSKSEFAMTDEEYHRRVKERSPEEKEAEAIFKLAVYQQQHGQPELAQRWWQRAQKLNPESWNYHGQEWSFGSEASKRWMEKFEKNPGDYYPKLELKEKQA